MKIDVTEEHESEEYPAIITEVVPTGQAGKAGVQVGMHVVAMNAVSTKGQTLDDIVQGVISAKTRRTPLVMTLSNSI